jgi:hypothetical protein
MWCGVCETASCLRMEVPEISVTIVNPGYVISEIHQHALGSSKEAADKRNLKEYMSTEECARQILVACANREREVPVTAPHFSVFSAVRALMCVGGWLHATEQLLMTWLGAIGYYLFVMLPELGDRMAIRKSEQGLGKAGEVIDAHSKKE